MGAGPIFAIVIVAVLAYLMPLLLSRRGEHLPDEVDSQGPHAFTPAAVMVRRASDPFDLGEDDFGLEVSTPFTRRAALTEIRRTDALAARWRRNVLVVLLVTTGAALIGAVVNRLPWWSVAVGALAVVAFMVLSRISAVALRRRLRERARQVRSGWDEETIAIAIDQVVEDPASHEHSVELSAPIADPGSWWDPIPVTTPTYVSKPLVPRSVRTIDLSAPQLPLNLTPPTAESPDQPLLWEDDIDPPQAVGQ